MDNMKIILALDSYSIYDYDTYYLCIPNNASNFYHLFIGFSTLDLKKLEQEELYKEIRKIGDSLNYAYSNAVYILPVIEPNILKEASCENDNRLYNKILKEYIQPITADIHNKFLNNKVYFSHVIKFIKQNDMDNKFISWISLKLGTDFVREITFNLNADSEVKPEEEKKVLKDVTIDHEMSEVWIKQQEKMIDDDLKPAISFGFSSLGFILMMLTISLVLGTILGYMIIK